MKSFGWLAVLLAGVLAVPAAYAQQSAAPAGSTGQCMDGSYTKHASRKGACSSHQGVKEWYAAAPAAAASPADAMGQSAGPQPSVKAAPGGGAGMVWVNDSDKVFHCQGDPWYGKTKAGVYMSEADAKAKGYHAEHDKACTQ